MAGSSTIIDKSLENYGSIDLLWKLRYDNNLSMQDSIPNNLVIDDSIGNETIKTFFKENNIIPVNEKINTSESEGVYFENLDQVIFENEDIALFENQS